MVSSYFKTITRGRILTSMESNLDNLEMIVSLFLAVFLTRKVFFDRTAWIYVEIYQRIPSSLKEFLDGKDLLTYAGAIPLLMIFFMILLRLVTIPIYRRILLPMADRLYGTLISIGRRLAQFFVSLWQLPASVLLVLAAVLLLNLGNNFIQSPWLALEINDSKLYGFINERAIQPALNSNIAKRIPILWNDAFRLEVSDPKAGSGTEYVPGAGTGTDGYSGRTGNRIKVIEYFNGVTLEEAIQSSPAIDDMAKKIVGNEGNSRKKAYLIYQWITSNIKYDESKVQAVSTNPRGVSSGSLVAFETKRGICFDYSCLYVSMCRAVGVKVRLVTGLAYSGINWGDHAWNQAYYGEEGRWMNVDTTFGTTANYFDKSGFGADHQHDDIHGEW